MTLLHYLVAFLLMLGPLVAVHEFGHFWVARRAGVKVMVFSIGFGPVIYKWTGKKNGTQYQLAAIPLGGYVKMADEREGEVPEADLPYAFNRQSVWKRMAIVAAGPLINLIFAVLLYWVLFLPDSQQINTRIGSVQANSLSATAGLLVGDKITSVDGRRVDTAGALHNALISRLGDTGQMQIVVDRAGQSVTTRLPIEQFLNQKIKDPLEILGFSFYQPLIPPIIGQIIPNGPAAKQGLKVGDTVLSIDGQAVHNALDLKRVIAANPNKVVPLVLSRTVSGQVQQITLNITPEQEINAVGTKYGVMRFGFTSQDIKVPEEYQQIVHHNPVQAFVAAVDKTWTISVLSIKSIGKLITGQLQLNNISGVITIANVSNQALTMGWVSFIDFMALMSVSLGIMNLLPIPVLDGGHLTLYVCEAVLGRPISEKTQAYAMKVGMAMLFGLMAIAFYYDFIRYDIVAKVLALFNDVIAML